MCKFSPTCRLECTDALLCPVVDAAFGTRRVKTTTLNNRGHWRDTGARRPKVRVNAQGQRLCCRENCPRQRTASTPYCTEHRRELYKSYRQAAAHA